MTTIQIVFDSLHRMCQQLVPEFPAKKKRKSCHLKKKLIKVDLITKKTPFLSDHKKEKKL